MRSFLIPLTSELLVVVVTQKCVTTCLLSAASIQRATRRTQREKRGEFFFTLRHVIIIQTRQRQNIYEVEVCMNEDKKYNVVLILLAL